MENSLNSYKSWVFNSAQNKSLIISELNWPSRIGLEIKDYTVQVIINGKNFVGHGSDKDSDLAILKATAEAYERYCVTALNLKNSNGCAVHMHATDAKEKAALELIERDCFLFKFINGIPFEKVDFYFNKINLDKKYKLTNYCLASGAYKVALTRIEINKSANIFGLSAEFEMKDAFMKSEIEALRQLMYATDRNLFSIANYDTINKKDKLSFDDHGDIALTSKHYQEIEFIFDQENLKKFEYFEYFDNLKTVFQFYEVALEKTNPFFGIPLVFVKAYNPTAQELYTGKTIENINPLRIKDEGNLNLCLHPFR